jgi:hypothetical protein
MYRLVPAVEAGHDIREYELVEPTNSSKEVPHEHFCESILDSP